MNIKNHKPHTAKAKSIPPEVLRDFFGAADVFQTPQSLLRSLLGHCSAHSLDAKEALNLIARDCYKLRLGNGKRVSSPEQFSEFFYEMANLLAEAPPTEKAPLPKE